MKLLKTLVFAAIAVAISAPAFAGRDEAQMKAQERAAEKLRTQGLAGPTGPQGQVGPRTHDGRVCHNIGHPTERVRC